MHSTILHILQYLINIQRNLLKLISSIHIYKYLKTKIKTSKIDKSIKKYGAGAKITWLLYTNTKTCLFSIICSLKMYFAMRHTYKNIWKWFNLSKNIDYTENHFYFCIVNIVIISFGMKEITKHGFVFYISKFEWVLNFPYKNTND